LVIQQDKKTVKYMNPKYKGLVEKHEGIMTDQNKTGISVIGGRYSLGLQYGDIIKILAPSNEKINSRIFFVDYIDHNWLRCIDIAQPDERYSYKIEWDEEEKEGFLIDTSIEQISLISRGDDLGYVKINRLQKDDILLIEWSIPQIPHIRVKIQEIILDAIEVVDLETKDVLYIDFEYKGIPEYIERIRVVLTTGIEGPLDERVPEDIYAIEEQPVEIGQSVLQVLSKQGDTVFREIVSMEDVTEDLDAIELEMEIPENQQRYTLDVQIGDISDHLYSRFPKHLHTPELSTAIITEINRFVELRQSFSEFQENGIIIPRKTETRPILRHYIQETGSFPYRVFIPVVQLKKKVYVDFIGEQEELLANEAFHVYDDDDEINNLSLAWDKYRKNVQQGDENRLSYLLQSLVHVPFLKPDVLQDKSLFNTPVKTRVPHEYWIAQDKDPAVSLHLQVINSKKNSMSSIYDISKVPYKKQRFLQGEKAYVSAIYIPDLKTIMETTTQATPFYKTGVPTTNGYNPIPEDVHLFELNTDNQLYSEYDESTFMRFEKPRQRSTKKKNIGTPLYGLKPTCFFVNPDFSLSKIQVLQSVTPTTGYLLQVLKNGGEMDDIYSLQHAVKKMSGWAISQENIRNSEAQDINVQIDKNIRSYMKEWRTRSGEWLRIAQQVFAYYKPANVRWNNLYTLFSSSSEGSIRVEQLKNAYQINFESISSLTTDSINISNSEIIRTILSIDNGRLFHLCLISLLLDWLTPEQFLSGSPDIGNTGSTENGARPSVIKTLSKKYSNEGQIEKDNEDDVKVFVDDDLLDGDTRQWIRKFEPILKRTKTEAEKREIVFQTLTDVDQLNQELAEKMTETILTGKKMVEDGDYAVLEIVQKATINNKKQKDVVMTRQYYKRIQGLWRLDKNLKDEDFGEEVGNLLQASKIRNQPVEVKNAIQFEFERRYSKIAETMKEQIEQDIETHMKEIVRKREWNKNRILSLNRGMVKQAGLYEEDKAENPILSPYVSLRDLVLAQTHEQKRQYDIVRFFQQYCRKATLTENPNWGYCLLTNTRLFPVSIYELAVVFNTGKTRDYNRKLAQVCSAYGVISDDGGSWVDKESGYTICLLDQVADGSDTLEYRRLAIVEQELKEAEIQNAIETLFSSSKEDVPDEDNGVLSVLFRFLNKQTGIQEKANSPLFNEINVLYQNTIIDPRIIISAKKYKATLAQKYAKFSAEELANKVRSEPTYEIYLDRMHIYVAISSYFAVLQLHRRKLKRSNIGVPLGCSFTLNGFPHDENPEKDEGIRYMACLLQDTAKIDERPWKSMKQQSQTVMVKNIKIILQNMVNNTPSLKNALKALPQNTDENDVRTDEYTHFGWTHFLPPIVPFSVKNLITGEKESHRLYLDEYSQTRKNKDTAYNKLKGLSILLAYGIVERINEIILKKKMLMKTMGQVPFLENTCCDDNTRSRNPVFYFCQEDPTLLKYIQYSRELNQDVERISTLMFSPMLFYRGMSWTTTFQSSAPVMQEATIKHLFIHFLYDKGVWNRTDVQAIYSFPAPPSDYNREWPSVKKMAMFQETIEKSGKWTDIRALYKRFIQRMNQDRIKTRREEYDTVELRMNRQSRFTEILQVLVQANSKTLYGRLLEEAEMSPTVRQIIGYKKPLLVHLETNGIVIPFRFLTVQEQQVPIRNSIVHIKNVISAFTTFLPQYILLGKKSTPNLPEHWVFTKADFEKIAIFIQKNTGFYQGSTKILKPIIVLYLEKVSVLNNLIQNIPEEMFTPIVFWNILSYVLVEVVYLYLETYYEINTVSTGGEIKNVLVEYLTATLDKMDKVGSWVEMSYETISQKKQMDADSEKNVIKQYLKEMTNEERKVENEMKKHKIGRWNVGKEIFIYDKRKQGVGFETQLEDREQEGVGVEISEEEEEEEERRREYGEDEEEEDGYDVDEGYDNNGDEEDDYYED